MPVSAAHLALGVVRHRPLMPAPSRSTDAPRAGSSVAGVRLTVVVTIWPVRATPTTKVSPEPFQLRRWNIIASSPMPETV